MFPYCRGNKKQNRKIPKPLHRCMCSEIWTEAGGRRRFSEIQRHIQTSWWCTDSGFELKSIWQVDVWMGFASVVSRTQAAEVNLASAWCYQRRQAEDQLSLKVMAQAELNIWRSFTFLHILLFNLWVLFFGSSPFSRISISLALFPRHCSVLQLGSRGKGCVPAACLCFGWDHIYLVRSVLHYSTSHRHHHHMCNFWHSPVNSHFG